MGDLTWSVKMSEELKEKISRKLLESGLTGKEFMEALLCSYELQNVKEKRPEMVADLQELEVLTKRLCAIYVNMGERISSILVDKENCYKESLEGKDDLIRRLEEKVRSMEVMGKELKEKALLLEKERDDIKAEKVNLERGFQNEIRQLNDINRSNKALIEEYKGKNDTLTGLLTDFETYKRDVQDLRAELEDEREKRKEAQEAVRDIEEKLKRSKDRLIQSEEQFKEQIKVLKEQCGYEKDRALLEQEKLLRNEMQMLREEYNGKVKGLLEELEGRIQGGGEKA